MNTFTKILGLGWLVAHDVNHTLKKETNSGSSWQEKKLPSYDLTDSSFWHDFCGVNIKNAPNANWREIGSYVSDGNEVRKFECQFENNWYFKTAQANVVGKSTTNFVFRGPYELISAIDIYFLIEKNLMLRKNLTSVVASQELRGKFDSVYDHIQWQNDDFFIEMSRDIESGDIELVVLSPFYNHDFLDEPFSKSTYEPYKSKYCQKANDDEEQTADVSSKKLKINIWTIITAIIVLAVGLAVVWAFSAIGVFFGLMVIIWALCFVFKALTGR